MRFSVECPPSAIFTLTSFTQDSEYQLRGRTQTFFNFFLVNPKISRKMQLFHLGNFFSSLRREDVGLVIKWSNCGLLLAQFNCCPVTPQIVTKDYFEMDNCKVQNKLIDDRKYIPNIKNVKWQEYMLYLHVHFFKKFVFHFITCFLQLNTRCTVIF